ncbi:MAG: hypothetical protein JXA52_08570 [Planctomycetes bacterium]|nr:hypothetical protein [Planctomycetota bacterium]
MGLLDGLFGGKKKDKAKDAVPATAKAKPSGRQDNINVDLSRLDTASKTATPVPADATSEEETAILKRGKIAEDKTKRDSGTSIARRKRASIARRLIGNLLLAAEAIDKRQLKAALNQKEEKGGLVGQILLDLEACSLKDLEAALNKQRTITTVDITQIRFDKEALSLSTREICVKHCLIPFQMIGKMLCVAMNNVLDSEAKEEIREYAQTHMKANSKTEERFRLKLFDAAWQQINEAIESHYPANGDNADLSMPPGARDITLQEMPQVETREVDIKIDLPEEEFVDKPPVKPAAPPSAIPVSEEFFKSAQEGKNGAVSESWQAERSADSPVPAEPVPDEEKKE